MAKAVYEGIGDKARKVKKMYVGVDGKARKVKKGYIGVNGVARLFFSDFPDAPASFTLIKQYDETVTLYAPEDGWYQIEVQGESGDGGVGYQVEYWDDEEAGTTYWDWSAGPGGGGGAYSVSHVKLNKGDTVKITVDDSGNITVKINSSTDETYNTMTVTAGEDGAWVYDGIRTETPGAGGTASGGNVINANGEDGSECVWTDFGDSEEDDDGKEGYCTGGEGGAGAHNNDGGHGSDAEWNDYWNINQTNGIHGFVNFYRGNTNEADTTAVVDDDTSLNLLHYSDWCESITGGWFMSYEVQENGQMVSGDEGCVRVETKNLELMGGGSVSTVNPIDVTNYSTLKFELRCSQWLDGVCGLFSSPCQAYDSDLYVRTKNIYHENFDNPRKATITIDVSDLSGSYYVGYHNSINSGERYDLHKVKLYK